MVRERTHSVLIVEDERIVAKDLQQSLAGMGYDAFGIASSADEAVARASEKCPDVVLMDIRIKGKRDGIETAGILRERFDVPVVYLTAHADDATIDRAKRTEPYGYLLKPVKSAQLRSAIEIALFRHEMEKRLRERERWFSTTLRSIADAVITVDLSGKVTFMNRAAELLTGTRVAEGVGRRAWEVVRLLDNEARVRAESPVDQVLRERESIESGEAGLLGAGAATRIISNSASPVVEEGELLGAVMVFRDITAQKLHQKQVELADRLASLGTMAAGVAHEVNNPLAVVVANATFVVEELGRMRDMVQARGEQKSADLIGLEEALEAGVELQSAARGIGRIVADLKAFSRPAPQASGHADVGRAIEWAVRTTAHEFQHRAHLITDVPGGVLATADESRLGRVFVNLLINAAQAIAPENVEANEVSIVARSSDSAGGRIVVDVSDTGCGIAPDALPRIFDPFFTTWPLGAGTGLGLSICHGIVSSMGGEIQVESTVGKGSRFRILLPAASTAPAAAAAAPPKREKLRGRILVVDDDQMVLHAIQRILRDHEVVCTETAREALAFIERGESFDVIFSDVMMPLMTGVEFYEVLLALNPDLARRVVFVSGGVVTATVEDFLQSVPNLRIEKPFDVVNMLDTVQRLLAKWSATGSRRKPS